jgi:hypothetical protein
MQKSAVVRDAALNLSEIAMQCDNVSADHGK